MFAELVEYLIERRAGVTTGKPDSREARAQQAPETLLARLLLRVDGTADGPAEHEKRALEPVGASRGCREAVHVPRGGRLEDNLELGRRRMVTLVADDHPIGGKQVFCTHLTGIWVLLDKGLERRHIDKPARKPLAPADLPHDGPLAPARPARGSEQRATRVLDVEEVAQPAHPLRHKRRLRHDDERREAALRDKVRSDDRLAKTRRRGEDAVLVLEQASRRLLLLGTERPLEGDPQLVTRLASVV